MLVSDVSPEHLQQTNILVVEDNALLARMAVEVLRRAGFTVENATNGLEALEAINAAALQGKAVDLVLMDLDMPVMDGLQATEKLRESEKFSTLPIIALTAYDESEKMEELNQAGFSDFIAKPFRAQDLVEKIISWASTLPKNTEKRETVSETQSLDRHAPESVKTDTQEDDLENRLKTIPDLDVSSGLARIGGGTDLYLKILNRFRQGYRTLADDLGKALEGGHSKDAARIAHSMNGLSGSIGAERLHQAAIALEATIRQGQNLPSMSSALVLEFIEAQKSLVANCDRFFEKHGYSDDFAEDEFEETEEKTGAPVKDPLSVLFIVEEIRTLINEDFIAAQDHAKTLLQRLEGQELERQAKQLFRQIDEFDLENAAETIDLLANALDVLASGR